MSSNNISKRMDFFKLNPSDLLMPSVILLIITNLVPIFGVLFLHWQVFYILLLFWAENVIVGFFNALRMLAATPALPSVWIAKLFMVPFFCFHYGMFTLVHGVFVFGFFGGYFTELESFPTFDLVFRSFEGSQLIWGIIALFISHAISFVINYLGKGEYKQAKLQNLMMQPYSRVVILHLTIIIGAFFVMISNAPAFILVILVILKIFIDLKAHLREHNKYITKEEPKSAPDIYIADA